MSNYYVGVPSSINTVSIDNYTVTPFEPTDVFTFDIFGPQNINLSLTDISLGDDADLYLYQDMNSNGVFDAFDQQFGLIDSSLDAGNSDESINVFASTGTYFAQVQRYDLGSFGAVSYDLDISTSLSDGLTNLEYSNLIPDEIVVGDIDYDLTYTNSVGYTDTADTYAFSLGVFEGVNISLTGLTADADIRLIQDSNFNNIVESYEVIGSSANGGSWSELISGLETSGSYYLQVNQFSGATNYALTFDHYYTPYA